MIQYLLQFLIDSKILNDVTLLEEKSKLVKKYFYWSKLLLSFCLTTQLSSNI